MCVEGVKSKATSICLRADVALWLSLGGFVAVVVVGGGVGGGPCVECTAVAVQSALLLSSKIEVDVGVWGVGPDPTLVIGVNCRGVGRGARPDSS